MTEPTDDELLALIEKHLGLKPRRDDTVIDPRTGRFHDVQRYRDLKADILAKWGTPPAGAGEHKPGCPALGGYGHGVGECCCGTTPQPTMAQAGAVPLTDEPDCGGESCDCRSYCKKEGGHHG